MITNSVVTIRKSIESQMYEITTVKPSYSTEGDISMRASPVKGFEQSPAITPSMELAAMSFANSQRKLYISPGEAFLTLLQEEKQYHILQVNPQRNEISEHLATVHKFNDTSLLRTAHKAHQLGASFRLPVNYHFFLPPGHENLTFQNTDPRNPGEGPLFAKANSRAQFLLRFRTKD